MKNNNTSKRQILNGMDWFERQDQVKPEGNYRSDDFRGKIRILLYFNHCMDMKKTTEKIIAWVMLVPFFASMILYFILGLEWARPLFFLMLGLVCLLPLILRILSRKK